MTRDKIRKRSTINLRVFVLCFYNNSTMELPQGSKLNSRSKNPNPPRSEVEAEDEVEAENKVEAGNQHEAITEVEVKLNQTKLNWAVTQLKLKLVNS